MDLTRENYHSLWANKEFMGASQFKSFMDCEARTIAEIEGVWQRTPSTNMLIGSYVDAHFSSEMDLFKAQHPEIFKKNGDLLSPFEKANTIIQRIERDPMMMDYLTGEHQVIKTGFIAGVPFKIMMDVYRPGERIVDQKIMRDFAYIWHEGARRTFVEVWGYDYQAAIYQATEGNLLPFILAAATKESEPDLALLQVPQDVIDDRLDTVKYYAPVYQMIKLGLQDPARCEKCDYCKATRVLTGVIDYRDLEDG